MVNVVVYGAGRLGQAVISAAQEEASSVDVMAAVDGHLVESGGVEVLGVPLYQTLPAACDDAAVEVIVDSSRADAFDEVLDFALSRKIPLVVAATGHSASQLAALEEAAARIPILHSSNLSLGVNVLRRLTEDATRMLGTVDTEIVEAHHRLKVDAPSGTALTLAHAVQSASDPDRKLLYGRRPDEVSVRGDEIAIHAIRGGTVVGEHTVTFFLNDEIVELRHVAQSRQVFGFGALEAAAFICDCAPGLYTMEDLLG